MDVNQELLRERIASYIKKIPSLPITVSKMLELENNPKVTPAALHRLISLDPVLSGRILKLVNSAFFGLDKEVTSIARAVIMLGLNTVKNLTLSISIMTALSELKKYKVQNSALDIEAFWIHSLCVAITAKHLARKRGLDLSSQEEYFMAGLLHDIGKIPMAVVAPQEYQMAIDTAEISRCCLVEEEEVFLGINHCVVGDMFLREWKLEGTFLGTAVFHHHDYRQSPEARQEYKGPYKDILFGTEAANYLAVTLNIGFAGDLYPGKGEPLIWQEFGVSQDTSEKFAAQITAEIQKAVVFLNGS